MSCEVEYTHGLTFDLQPAATTRSGSQPTPPAFRRNHRGGGAISMSREARPTWDPDSIDLEQVHHYARALREALRPGLSEDTRRNRRFNASIWLKLLERELNPTLLPLLQQGPFRGPVVVREALRDLRDICHLLAQQWGIADLWRGGMTAASEPLSLPDPTPDLCEMLTGVVERLGAALPAALVPLPSNASIFLSVPRLRRLFREAVNRYPRLGFALVSGLHPEITYLDRTLLKVLGRKRRSPGLKLRPEPFSCYNCRTNVRWGRGRPLRGL